MKIGLTSKLFLVLLATNVVIAIALGVAIRLAFNAGFREYVGEREERRLSTLADALAAAYRDHGNWDFLRDNDALWRAFNRPPPRAELRPGAAPPFAGDRTNDSHPPPLRPRPRDDRDDARPVNAPPPHSDRPNDRPPPGAPGGRDRGPPPVATLLDAQRQRVVGSPKAVAGGHLRAITVDGSTVGWLSSDASDDPFSTIDARFQKEQLGTTWIIGCLAIMLAAAVASVLARSLLAPVKRLAEGSNRLAAGDYASRVAVGADDELGRLTADFNRLAETLQNDEQTRRAFLADVSHELRTPLAILKGELEALEDGVRTLTPDAMKSLQQEVATLGKLIDDLYTLSLADAGELHYRFDDVDFTDLVKRVVGAFGERFASKRIAVEADVAAGLAVHGDSDRLTQLLNNVLENSFRYTDPDGRLRVTARRDGPRIALDVQDSAPAVPEALLPRVFERLFRVEASRNRERGGAGLGLSLCRSIVEAHGGEIHARPSPLGGLWIRIELPRSAT